MLFCSPAFAGTIDGQGTKLSVQFDNPTPGVVHVDLEGGEQLGEAIDANEDLADDIMRTSITILGPTIGTLDISSGKSRGQRKGPSQFQYVPGWKMFFSTSSPHHARAVELATRTEPTGHGALCTFGTPDTYPDILDQW